LHPISAGINTSLRKGLERKRKWLSLILLRINKKIALMQIPEPDIAFISEKMILFRFLRWAYTSQKGQNMNIF